MFNKSIEERFWSKVEIPENEDACWIWKASVNSKGYGTFGINGKIELSHRVCFIMTHGDIPDRLLVMHTCDNRRCVNPSHLKLGTHKDNMEDMVAKGRQAKGEKNGQSKLTAKEVEEIRELYRVKKIPFRALC